MSLSQTRSITSFKPSHLACTKDKQENRGHRDIKVIVWAFIHPNLNLWRALKSSPKGKQILTQTGSQWFVIWQITPTDIDGISATNTCFQRDKK